ncbi:acetate--CoA ligase family protein [Halohasta litorea]|uniref:acetate--CoA ligase (ADP-forming) n=1 Tax=Halohasta litorea TaxID=869891 RepID=A0ABD6D9A1_9EURY|nr:acetate--CoA ligase [Halohasta litorea]
MTDLSGLFDPDRIAVIGATDREGSVGRALLENLATFDGEIVPVNPNRETVLDADCYPSIEAAPNPTAIDLAVVAVPATVAVDVVRQVGEQGIKNVVVITAGFSETDAEGRRRERELAAVAAEYDLDLVGPNSVGVISTATGLNGTFLEGRPPEGSLSLLSQSGAFIAAVIGWATQHNIGFNDVVSLGNETVLDEVDFLYEWDDDPGTDVILAYVEDIDEGRAFIETARDVTASTPVVVIKSGRTEAGAAAAKSHTGSMAGSDDAYDAAFEQAGVIRAEDIQDVFDFGQVLAGQPRPDGDNVAVVTNGGGPGVLTTDAVGDSSLDLAEFGVETRTALDELLPAAADSTNPLDIIGDADLARFEAALDTVLADKGVDGAVVLSVPTALYEFAALAETIGDLQAEHGTPVVACLMGGEPADRAADTLAQYGIPNYFDPSRAVASLETLADYGAVLDRAYEPPAEFEVDRKRASEILAQTDDRDVDYLGVEAMALLDAYGIPTPPGELVESPEAAAAVAERIGGPVVMKIASPEIVHKSDIGGVEVGVPTDAVADTYRTILDRARSHAPETSLLGVRVEGLVDPAESTETIIGAKRDPQFGHLLMFGLGGIFVQIYEDTAFRIAPVSEHEARAMTDEIRAAPMLRGTRGRTPADIDRIVETIQRVSQLLTDFPAITELDINPLVVSPEGVSAIDVRVRVDTADLSPPD